MPQPRGPGGEVWLYIGPNRSRAWSLASSLRSLLRKLLCSRRLALFAHLLSKLGAQALRLTREGRKARAELAALRREM